MKLHYIIIMFIAPKLIGQSIVSTTAGKSAILVDSKKDFAGISYENASDEFTFNYKSVNQEKLPNGEESKQPPKWGSNVGLGIDIDKNKSKLISDRKWQGGFNVDYTHSYCWTNKSIGQTTSTTTIPYGQAEHKETNYKQNTFYGKLSGDLERYYSFETTVKNKDTTFVNIENPLQTTMTLTAGFYQTIRYRSVNDFSWGVSSNISYILNSVRTLKESTLSPFKGIYINQEDNSNVINLGEQEKYRLGKPQNEFYFVPRADLFYRYSGFGDKKPVVGIIASYSPLISSLKNVAVRNCFAFGPTFGMPSNQDQVVFALINEFVQDTEGRYKYELTFNVSIPINFK